MLQLQSSVGNMTASNFQMFLNQSNWIYLYYAVTASLQNLFSSFCTNNPTIQRYQIWVADVVMQNHNVAETQYCFLFFIYTKKSARFDYLYLLKLVYLYNVNSPRKVWL